MKELCTRRNGQSLIRHPQSGQSLLELAFLVPLLLLLALGVIEVGRYAYIAVLVGNAAHAGAIYGSQSLPQSNDPLIVTAARNDFQSNGQPASSLAVTYFTTCGCDSAGTVAAATACSPPSCGSGHWVVLLSVTASGTFSALFSYPGIPASITVSRTSTIRVAQI
jgi:Flp pilus assembly protein TadG